MYLSTGLFYFLLIIFLLSPLSCEKRESKSKSGKDTLIIAISAEPNRINPILVSDSISFSVSSLIYRGLTKVSKERDILPDLARSWNFSKDGKELTFYLRKDVRWHDGSPFTADDVIATFREIIKENTVSPHSESFSSISSITALDRHTIKITYQKPFASALQAWTIGILPNHRLKDYDLTKSDKEISHIGTGAYRLTKWQPADALYFEANDNFYEDTKPINQLILKVIPDSATQMMALKAGSVDMIELTTEQSIHESQDEGFKRQFNVHTMQSYRWGFLGLNLKDSRFQDARVRQAIAHGIDKKSIIDGVFKGFATISTGPYPPEAWYYNKEAPHLEFNQEKAIRLLREAGWQRDDSGLLFKGGRPFNLEIITNSESREHIKVAQIIQQHLREIGINVKIQLYEWQTFRHKAIEEREFQAILLSRVYLNSPDIYQLWHSKETNKGQWNILSYKDKELDTMLERSRTITDMQRQRDMYHKIHSRLAEQQACVFLYNLGLSFAIRKDIKAVELSPNGIFDEIHRWRKD